LWKYNFTEAHYLIFAGPGGPKESPGAAFAASAAPVRTPMIKMINCVPVVFIKLGNSNKIAR